MLTFKMFSKQSQRMCERYRHITELQICMCVKSNPTKSDGCREVFVGPESVINESNDG